MGRKTPTLKRIVIKALILGALSLVLVINGASSQVTYAATICENVTSGDGSTDAWGDTPKTTSNSGAFNFNLTATGSRACVNQDVSSAISGWTWNTNAAGYVSLRCESGLNRGVSCGSSVDYGAGILELGTTGTYMLAGYAWSDGIGWISLGCQDYNGDGPFENYLDPTDPSTARPCGTIPYGVELDVDGLVRVSAATNSPYIWSETIGWMSFATLSFPFNNLEVTFDPPADGSGSGGGGGGITVGAPGIFPFVLPDEGRMPVGSGRVVSNLDFPNGIPYADGRDGYGILIQIKRGAEVEKDSSAGGDISAITITVDDTQNINTDQINGVGPEASHVSSFVWNSSLNGYVGAITSVAPTNASNTYRLNSVTVTATVGGKSVSGTKILNQDLEFAPAIALAELTAKDINTGVYQPACDMPGFTCTLSASANVPNDVRMRLTRYTRYTTATHPLGLPTTASGTINLLGFVDNSAVDVKTRFVDDQGDTYVDGENNAYEIYFVPGSGELPLQEVPILDTTTGEQIGIKVEITTPKRVAPFDLGLTADFGLVDGAVGVAPEEDFTYFPYLPADANAPGFADPGAGLEAYLSFKVQPTVTLNYDLKTLASSQIVNQFVKIFGNLRVDKGAFRQVVQLDIGNPTAPPISKAEKIDFFLNASKTLSFKTRGKKIGVSGGVQKLGANGVVTLDAATLSTWANGNVPNLPKVLHLNHGTVNGAQVGKPIKVIIADAATIKPPKMTVVVEGGNLFLDRDIMSPIGLVTLESARVNMPHGNVFICASVTEIHAQIRSEGSLLSYGQDADGNSGNGIQVPAGDQAVCNYKSDADFLDADGFVKIDDTYEREILRNQLAIFGSVTSLNIPGASTLLPPLKSDGTRVLNDPKGVKQARRQDINYLRYAKVRRNDDAKDDDTRPDQFIWHENMEYSPSLGDVLGEGDEDIAPNYPPKYGIVNLLAGENVRLPLLTQ